MTIADDLLVGVSAEVRRLRRLIERIASARLPVLIEGPTGTGKELVATLLHQLSGRRGALVAFNVCAVADTMFEDALFGHVRGAYTGAGNDAPGFLREAHGGTVFLDEIGGLTPTLQPKLLRALETGVFRPIGSSRDSTSDFRIVAATNEGMSELVSAGRFRSDLAHRLSGIVLSLPSLADRCDDIAPLVTHFARGHVVDADALSVLQRAPWPGNVRELKQVVDAALVLGRGRIDLTAVEQAFEHRPRPVAVNRARTSSVTGGTRDLIGAERSRVVELLELASWDTERVAGDLGVHRSTLYRRLKRLGVDLPPAMCIRECDDCSSYVVEACCDSRQCVRIGANHASGSLAPLE